MPCACAIADSSGCVMKPATVAASAPSYAVLMVTTAFSVWGYWLTGKLPTERKPSTRISRLMTTASTGRLMKRSVKFMARALSFLRRWALVVERLHCVVDAQRRAVLQFELSTGDHHR